MINLKTERLILRPLMPDDAFDFFDYRSDSAANKYQGWIPRTPQDACDFINKKITSTPNIPDTWIQLAILLRQEKTLIGDIGVYFVPNKNNTVKLGYTLAVNHQGKGYATEALHILIDHLMIAYEKTKFIVLISPDNLPSIRLARRLGFIMQSQNSNMEFRNNDYPDDLLFILDMI